MMTILDNIRKANTDKPLSQKLVNSVLILFLGIALGSFSKWLDNMALDDSIWWHHILGFLDLRNVFSGLAVWLLAALMISVFSSTPLRAAVNVFLFFAGTCVSYHLYTVVFSGFNPSNYMLIWYGLTLVSPVIAAVCWYGKGKTTVSIVIDTVVVAVMSASCFSVGLFYFGFNGIVNLLIFAGSIAVLYSGMKQAIISLAAGLFLSMFISLYLPFV